MRYDLDKETKEHMELYADKFEEWNSDKLYKPSFLFNPRKILKYIQIFDFDDGEEALKWIFKVFCFYSAIFVSAILFFTLI